MRSINLLIVAAVIATARVQAETPPPPPQPPSDHPALTEQQRAENERRLDEAWGKLSLEGKARLMRLHRALREMPAAERRFIHDRIERFLNLSSEDKQKIRENAERWRKMTPEQREQARQEFRARRRQFEEKWKQEHPGEDPPPFPFRGAPESAPPPPPPPATEP